MGKSIRSFVGGELSFLKLGSVLAGLSEGLITGKIVYEISKSWDFAEDFWISGKISRFHADFKISCKISRFHARFQDFCKISRFQ